MSDQPTDNPLLNVDTAVLYRAALERAWNELAVIIEQKKQIATREAQLNETVRALTPLVGEWTPDLTELSLSNAVRFVFNGLAIGRTLSAMDVRTKLEELGYNLSEYENPLANIHTCMRRMIDSEELTLVETKDNKKQFEAGPELKSVPLPEPIVKDTEGKLQFKDLIALSLKEDKK
jgi:hypothetical protein